MAIGSGQRMVINCVLGALRDRMAKAEDKC
jgi:hypothetical protein